MIQIFKANSELGVALFDIDTNKFLYGELCNKERLMTFVNSFPEHEVTIFIERAWQDEIQDIFFLLPHLQDLATVKVLRKINVRQSLAKSAKEKKKRNPIVLYLLTGIILGCLLLIPTSMEYRSSVLAQAQSIQKNTEEFVQKQPDVQSRQQLYTSIADLYLQVDVEAVTYSADGFKVIFASANQDLQNTDFKGFESATLTKVSSLQSEKGANVHIYELEGSL